MRDKSPNTEDARLNDLLAEAAAQHEVTLGLQSRILSSSKEAGNGGWLDWLLLHPLAGATSAFATLVLGVVLGAWLPAPVDTTAQANDWSSVSMLALEDLNLAEEDL